MLTHANLALDPPQRRPTLSDVKISNGRGMIVEAGRKEKERREAGGEKRKEEERGRRGGGGRGKEIKKTKKNKKKIEKLLR